MIEFLVIYFAIGGGLTLIFFLISLFIQKMQDQKLLAIYCLIMFFLWPFILVKLIIDIIRDKIANKKLKNYYETITRIKTSLLENRQRTNTSYFTTCKSKIS